MSLTSIVPTEPLLFSFQGTLTEHGIGVLLDQLNYSHTLEHYVEQNRRLYYLRIGGPITFKNFSVEIRDGRGLPKVEIEHDFKVYYRVPILGEGEFTALPLQISAPSIRVELSAYGSQGFAVFSLDSLKMKVGVYKLPGLVQKSLLEEVWNRVKQSLSTIQEELTKALNEILEEQPVPLFDLNKVTLPLGEGKNIDTRVHFDTFGFHEDHIAVAVRLFAHPKPPTTDIVPERSSRR
jgi:hypothetical protein